MGLIKYTCMHMPSDVLRDVILFKGSTRTGASVTSLVSPICPACPGACPVWIQICERHPRGAVFLACAMMHAGSVAYTQQA